MNKHIILYVWLAVVALLLPAISQARYLNVSTGRFMTMDTYAGNNEDTLSLHKYLYAADDPVNKVDPSGQEYGDFDISLSSIGGLLAKIGTPVTSETGVGVFGSDLVLLEAHPVAFGVNHSYIALIVGSSSPFFSDPQFNHIAGSSNLHYATLGAGPSFGTTGKLINGVDRPRDLARSTRVFSAVIQPPGGMTADQFIQMLLNINSLYDDQANYALFPDNDQDTSDPNFDEYNSNSYASGLLKLGTGVIAPQPPNTPGFLFPVPVSFFPGVISR